METKWRKLFLILSFIGFNRAQQFSSFERRFGSLSGDPASSFGSRFRLSSGSLSPQRGSSSGAWLSAPPLSVSSSSLLPGSSVSRRMTGQSNRLVLDNTNNNNVRLVQPQTQAITSQQSFQQLQQPQHQQVLTAQQTQRTVLSQPRQTLTQPQSVVAKHQPVLTQPRTIQTVQQVQPVATSHQVALPQQTHLAQTVQTTLTGQTLPAVQTPTAINHVPAQGGATLGSAQGLVSQVPGMVAPQSPIAQMGGMAMHSPMGMGSPMGMIGAMNPMAAMMGSMGPMGPMGMGMGMPFMTYDTMEDLFLDPDRPSRPMPGAAAAVAAATAASGSAVGPAMAAGPSIGTRAALPAGSVPTTGQISSPQVSSAASMGLGHLAAPAASVGISAPQGTVPVGQPVPAATGGASLARVDPSVIQSALQTALSRVQQRQSGQAPVVG